MLWRFTSEWTWGHQTMSVCVYLCLAKGLLDQSKKEMDAWQMLSQHLYRCCCSQRWPTRVLNNGHKTHSHFYLCTQWHLTAFFCVPRDNIKAQIMYHRVWCDWKMEKDYTHREKNSVEISLLQQWLCLTQVGVWLIAVNCVGLKMQREEDVIHTQRSFLPRWLPSQVQTTDVVIFQLNLQMH